VVREVVVPPVQAEVEHDAGASGLQRSPQRLCVRHHQQFAIGADSIAVGHHGGQRHGLACLGDQAGHPTGRRQDPRHRSIRPELDAQRPGQLSQRPGNRADPADGIPDPFVKLHVGDATQHCGRLRRVRAHVLGEMVQHLGHPRLGHMVPHRAGHAPPGPQVAEVAEQARLTEPGDLQRVAQTANGLVEEEPLREVVEACGIAHEGFIAGGGARTEPLELVRHGGRVRPEVEPRAVLEEAAPLRVEPDQVERFGQRSVGLGEDAMIDRRDGQNGRPEVEPEPPFRPHRGLAAKPPIGLEDRHSVAAGGEGARRGQAAESSPNHADRRVLTCGHRPSHARGGAVRRRGAASPPNAASSLGHAPLAPTKQAVHDRSHAAAGTAAASGLPWW